MKKLVLIKHSQIKTAASVEYQCKASGHRAYDYEIEIVVNPEKLDEFDFIIDHSVVHDVIKDVIQNDMGSCERLCLRIEDAVLKKLKEHGAEVYSMVLAIKPVDSNAWVRIESDYTLEKFEKQTRIAVREKNELEDIEYERVKRVFEQREQTRDIARRGGLITG